MTDHVRFTPPVDEFGDTYSPYLQKILDVASSTHSLPDKDYREVYELFMKEYLDKDYLTVETEDKKIDRIKYWTTAKNFFPTDVFSVINEWRRPQHMGQINGFPAILDKKLKENTVGYEEYLKEIKPFVDLLIKNVAIPRGLVKHPAVKGIQPETKLANIGVGGSVTLTPLAVMVEPFTVVGLTVGIGMGILSIAGYALGSKSKASQEERNQELIVLTEKGAQVYEALKEYKRATVTGSMYSKTYGDEPKPAKKNLWGQR